MQSTTIGSRMTSFIPLSSRSASLAVGGSAGLRRNEREQHRVGRGQRGAEDGRGGPVEAEQDPGGEGDHRRGEQGAGPEDQRGQAVLL